MKNKPLKLKQGDTIGIICPAFKNSQEDLKENNSIEKIEQAINEMGFKAKFGKSVFSEYSYLAGTDEDRAKEIEEMFKDDNIKAILCMRGGYGASRIVDKINYKIIKKNPKIFCGYSDITVLLNAINQKCNIPTLHGLAALSLISENIDEFSKKSFYQMLTDNTNDLVLKNKQDNCVTLVKGIANGELVGGNLSLINTLVGTNYDVSFKNKIVFIEEVDEEPYQIDRYLSCIRLAGKLKEAKGFVFGYFTDCTPSKKRQNAWSAMDVVKNYIKELNKPTIYNFNCGHDYPFITIPIGLKVELNADNKTIKILENFYKEKINE